MRKENDAESKKRLAAVDDEIKKTKKESANLEEIWSAERARIQSAQKAQNERDRLRAEAEKAKQNGDWQRLAEIQNGELPALESGVKISGNFKLLRTEVGVNEIAETVSRATGIPTANLLKNEREKLLNMEEKLSARVVDKPPPSTPSPTPFVAPAPACRRLKDLWGFSCFWGRPVWAKPNCAKHWRNFYLIRKNI